MKVLAIGESIIDKVYRVDTVEKPNLESVSPVTHVGGTVIAALIVLARMDIKCTLVTTLGRDDEAKIIKKVLKHEKIKLLHKIQRHTKVNTILVDKRTGQRKKVRGSTIHPDIKNLDRNFLRQFDLIIMDRHEKTAFYEVLQKKKPTAKIVIDPSIEVSTHTLDMIKYADYPIIPIESLVKICSGDIMTCLKKLYSLANKQITITAGELGSLIFDGQALHHVKPYEVTAVDVNGAGDVYRGAFTYGLTQGWDMHKCATFGNYVAGLQCTRPGNVAGIPTKTDMQKFETADASSRVTMPIVHEYFSSLYQTA